MLCVPFVPSPGFNSQPPKGGCLLPDTPVRPKRCFNSQPPKGGCRSTVMTQASSPLFQFTAARRRLHKLAGIQPLDDVVSTHSRPKAAAAHLRRFVVRSLVSTHSRPKAAASGMVTM